MTQALVVGGLLVSFCEVVLRTSGRGPLATRNDDSLFDPDPMLGWRKKVGRHFVPAPDRTDPDLVNTVWPDGSRATAASPMNSGRRVVLVGCSWTQGIEVTDEDTLGWKLQAQRPDLAVRNHGTGGFGTVGALLTLREVLPRSSPSDVVYGYIPHHQRRNVLSADWIDSLEGGVSQAFLGPPFATLTSGADGQGLRLDREWLSSWPGSRQSATVHAAERLWREFQTADRTATRAEVTRRLAVEMDRLVRRQGGRLVVAVLGVPESPDEVEMFRRSGLATVNCSFPLGSEFLAGSHPNGRAHAQFAACISDALGGLSARAPSAPL